MKTTIEIEDQLLRQAKKTAIDRGCTLRQLVESGLRREIAPAHPRTTGRVPHAYGSGKWPEGLDISTREKMWDWIESEPREDETGA